MALRHAHLHSSDARSRWNFDGTEPDLQLFFDREVGHVIEHGKPIRTFGDPLQLLDWMSANGQPGGRWVGYISYGVARFIERLPANGVDDLSVPLLAFGRFKHSPASANQEIAPTPGRPSVRRRTSKESYQKLVKRVIEYIVAGDVFQVNLAQRIDVSMCDEPEVIWQRLIGRYPSQLGALLQFDDFSVISNSPELFFRVDPQSDGSRSITSRPIKGTRPRKPGMLEELSQSSKDIAELAMIVDLQRNDLGRVCEIGSVKVTNAREIEIHPTVYHGVATIGATLRREAGFADVIRAMFPCGSITGCPKIRAMEIIDELEEVERGPYCGAIGYLDPDGSAEFNVAIRTMTIKGGVAAVMVGGGIVADSTPLAEYDETLDKAAALLDSLGIDVNQLRD